MTKPFKTVTTEYFEELDEDQALLIVDRRIKVVTTTKQWIGSDKDPIVSTTFEYF
jgi:hypothetical protein